MTVFAPRGLSKDLIRKLDHFLQDPDIDFRSLYKSYDWKPKSCASEHGSHKWKQDTYEDEFPNVHRLEVQLRDHVNSGNITCDDIKDIVCWSGPRENQDIKIDHRVLVYLASRMISNPDTKFLDDDLMDLDKTPSTPIILLYDGVKGIGVTYTSKVLRFALPEQYGAIDTRLVRVFGEGDQKSRQHHWLTLKVSVPGNWRIDSSQKNWPSEYGTWINILRYFAQSLNEQKIECPHPKSFVKSELRKDNAWTCADVEMALFAYASKHVKN